MSTSICSGTTNTGRQCFLLTGHASGRCQHHRPDKVKEEQIEPASRCKKMGIKTRWGYAVTTHQCKVFTKNKSGLCYLHNKYIASPALANVVPQAAPTGASRIHRESMVTSLRLIGGINGLHTTITFPGSRAKLDMGMSFSQALDIGAIDGLIELLRAARDVLKPTRRSDGKG